jgi:hypothetical protein
VTDPPATVVLAVRFPEMSLRGPLRLRRAAQWIKAEIDRGTRPVVVVGTRSRREERGFTIAGAREIDRARAAAADLAAASLALALTALGVSARSLGPRDVQLEGVGEFGAAVLHRLDARPVGRLLANRVTPVLAGGQIVRRDGEIAMLEAGGPDLTAVVLAAALGSVPCHFLVDRATRQGTNVRRVHFDALERARALGVRIATRTPELAGVIQSESGGPPGSPTTSLGEVS